MVMVIILPHQNVSCGDASPHAAVALLEATVCGKNTKIANRVPISPYQVGLHVLGEIIAYGMNRFCRGRENCEGLCCSALCACNITGWDYRSAVDCSGVSTYVILLIPQEIRR
jgi:hypothetical protein